MATGLYCNLWYTRPIGPLVPEVMAEMGDRRESIRRCSSGVRLSRGGSFFNSVLKRQLMGRKTAHRDMALFPIQHIKYPYHISTAFPPVVLDSNGRVNGSRRPSSSSLHKPNMGLNFDIEMLEKIQIVDYRYSRFALDPRTGLFSIIRFVSYFFLLFGMKLILFAVQRLERFYLENHRLCPEWAPSACKASETHSFREQRD